MYLREFKIVDATGGIYGPLNIEGIFQEAIRSKYFPPDSIISGKVNLPITYKIEGHVVGVMITDKGWFTVSPSSSVSLFDIDKASKYCREDENGRHDVINVSKNDDGSYSWYWHFNGPTFWGDRYSLLNLINHDGYKVCNCQPHEINGDIQL